jgi:hypothetical protein
MLANTQRSRGCLVLLGLLLGAGVSAPQSGNAQSASDGGYAVTEDGGVRRPDPVSAAGTQENTGPVRLARISFVRGNVTWRSEESSDWSAATRNLPLRQGAQIWVSEGGRAEIQFDDGSLLRLGTGAVVTLQTLYSDSDGEFTELKMTDGLASLRLRHDRGVYQVNTPLGSIKAAGPASLRIGVGNGLELAVKSGKATIEGGQGKADLQGGDYLDLSGSNSPYNVRNIPRADSWDRWNQDRDDMLARAENTVEREHLPADIAIVADDLNDNGSWRNDSQSGWVWCPRVTSSDWRPYHDGQWTWVNPFGWTWVSNEDWGWAPYHYGTWISRPYGWAWCPGPVNQYWSPAVVHFSEYGGQVGWCPLAPSEVRYPTTFGFGFRSGNWATYFAIGGAAVYYPTEYGYCTARVYDTRYVNRVTYINNVTNITNVYNNNNASYTRLGLSQESYAANNNTVYNGRSAFVPVNSRNAAGVTSVRTTDFGGRGVYTAVAKSDNSLFVRGRAVAAPLQGRAPLAGPISVVPTRQAMTPTRTFTAAPQASTNRAARPVYRAAVMPSIAQNSAPITPTGKVVTTTQTQFVRPTVGTNVSTNVNRTGRSVPTDRTATGSVGRTGTTGRDPAHIQVQPRGDSTARTGDSRTGTAQPGTAPSKTGITPDRRSPGNDTRGSSNPAAEAAAQARASLGISRSRPNGGSSDGSGSSDRTTRPTRDTGSNSSGTSSPSRDSGSPNYRPATSPRSESAPPRDTSSTYTPRPTQTAPSRSEPNRSEPTRSEAPRPTQTAPPRSEPTRSEPTRSESPRQAQPTAPRSEPTRSEPARSEPRPNPPAREPEKPAPSKGSSSDKSPDKSSDNSSDSGSGSKGSSNSTNRGRPGRGG